MNLFWIIVAFIFGCYMMSVNPLLGGIILLVLILFIDFKVRKPVVLIMTMNFMRLSMAFWFFGLLIFFVSSIFNGYYEVLIEIFERKDLEEIFRTLRRL